MEEDYFYQKVSKQYIHIDFPLSRIESRNFFNSLNNITSLKSYRFSPLLQFDITFKRHPKPGKSKNIKKRGISLVSHHDAGVYAFLAEQLNSAYNDYSYVVGISDSSVAYRSNLPNNKKISNITVAKEAFDFIDKNQNVWVMKGDFTGFFDNLDHQILNKNVRKVLGLSFDSPELNAWYTVLKSLEKYIYIEKGQLLKKLDSQIVKRHNQLSYFKSRKDFGLFIRQNKYLLHKNKKRGIPQGTSISAILANVYMVEFDKIICNYLTSVNGMYRRYSDDFIITIPKKNLSQRRFNKLVTKVQSISKKIAKLEIEKNKTKIFSIESGNVITLNNQKEGFLDYLGFIYKDNTVYLRGKSIYKFYYRGRRAVKAAFLAKETYEILETKFKYNYTIDDLTARKVLEYLPHKQHMHPAEERAQLNRIMRVMHHHKAKAGLPEVKDSYKKYLMKIENASPRYSFLSYVQSVNKVFAEGKHSYKVSILHQANKARNKMDKIRVDISQEYES